MKTTKKKQNIIGLKEFRLNADKYISRIEKGESFTVLKRSNPVFKLTPVDDEEMWETVVDFTEINPEGVPVEDVIKMFKEIHG
jgi:antitoxin (DNA-binding transcriptional repressor) of toxin-antitoxin stability system